MKDYSMEPEVPLWSSTSGIPVVAMPPRTDVPSGTWNALFADGPIPPPVAVCDRAEMLTKRSVPHVVHRADDSGGPLYSLHLISQYGQHSLLVAFEKDAGRQLEIPEG